MNLHLYLQTLVLVSYTFEEMKTTQKRHLLIVLFSFLYFFFYNFLYFLLQLFILFIFKYFVQQCLFVHTYYLLYNLLNPQQFKM